MPIPPPVKPRPLRFCYPLTLLALAILAIAASFLGLTLLDPVATALAIVIMVGTFAGTGLILARGDAAVLAASVCSTVLAGPAVGMIFEPEGFRFQLVGIILLGSLIPLLLGCLLRPMRAGDGGGPVVAIRVVVLAVGSLALIAGFLVNGLMLVVDAMDSVGFGVTTTTRNPSPDGSWDLISTYIDDGALGGANYYKLTRRPLPFVQQEADLPFNDGYQHGIGWLDSGHLSVDGRTWTIGGGTVLPPETTRREPHGR